MLRSSRSWYQSAACTQHLPFVFWQTLSGPRGPPQPPRSIAAGSLVLALQEAPLPLEVFAAALRVGAAESAVRAWVAAEALNGQRRPV